MSEKDINDKKEEFSNLSVDEILDIWISKLRDSHYFTGKYVKAGKGIRAELFTDLFKTLYNEGYEREDIDISLKNKAIDIFWNSNAPRAKAWWNDIEVDWNFSHSVFWGRISNTKLRKKRNYEEEVKAVDRKLSPIGLTETASPEPLRDMDPEVIKDLQRGVPDMVIDKEFCDFLGIKDEDSE